MTRVLPLVLLCVLTVSSPAWCETVAGPPGRMVDVGGRRLHLLCVGAGSPTVVFESGLGEGSYAWALVQPAVGRQYRACSYDRSGIAFSDPDPAPRSVAGLVSDLHELLGRSGERGPYLLVGHSLGGLFVRRYAMRYPDEVAGLVLVDSSHEDGRRTASREIADAQAKALAARGEQMKRWRVSGQFEEMGFHDKVPKSMLRVLKPRSGSENWWDARFRENSLPDAQDDLTPEQRRLQVPVVVITATEWPTPRNYPPIAWKQHIETRMRLQEELASRSPRSKHIVVRTEHHVQFENPDIVIKSIVELARHWRTWPSTGSPSQ